LTLVELLVVITILGILVCMLLPAVQVPRGGSRRTRCRSRLQSIGLATHMYFDVHGSFPPGVADTDNDFRQCQYNGFVLILPYLEHKDLHGRYDFDLAWDTGSNPDSASQEMVCFQCPTTRSADPASAFDRHIGTPADFAFCKGGAAYLCNNPLDDTVRGMFDINSSVHPREVTRGLSNTLAVGEAAYGGHLRGQTLHGPSRVVPSQVWTKASFDGEGWFSRKGGGGSILAVTAQNAGPDHVFGTVDDLLTPPNERIIWLSDDATPGGNCSDAHDRVRGFNSFHRGGANFVLADSSTWFISDSINPQLYRKLSLLKGEDVGDWK
jgi:type II secretory pathway pseudopilin PulG